MTPVPLLELLEVTKTYPAHPPAPPVQALRGITLEVAAGEMVAIMGPSGSGKSTLLNIIGLLDEPSTGTYRLAGEDVNGVGDRRRTALRAGHLGFVFQAFHLVNHLDVVRNVALPLMHLGISRAERRDRARAQLDAVGLGHRLTSRPQMLSGGERQRVAIARAIVHQPAIVLCDEPTGNLDTDNGTIVMDLLRAAVGPDRAVIVVTHDPAVAATTDRTITVVDGHAG